MGFRYSCLFETEWQEAQVDLTSWWRPQPSRIPVGKMGYKRSVTLAGPRMECEIYPVFGRADEMKARAAKANLTPEKQRKLNLRRSEEHLVRLLDTNFTEKEVHVTLTYRGDPSTYEEAYRDMRNYILKLKRYRKKMGMEDLKYIYNIEGGRDARTGYALQRMHIHMVTNGGMNREDLEAIWEKGYANCDRLQPNERGLEELGKYIIKQHEQGKRWCASRNLKQPKRRASDVRTSNSYVKRMAYDMQAVAKEQMERLYPSYQYVECKVFYSDIVDGVYIKVLMRKKETGNGAAGKKNKRQKRMGGEAERGLLPEVLQRGNETGGRRV